MSLSAFNPRFMAKAFLAASLLAILAGVAGAQLVPNLPLALVLLYSVLGAVALLVIMVVVTTATLTLAQFILRKGGTDPQWFWFNSEPPGLVQLRAQEKAESGKPDL
jgi:ABC-type multidrug transport system permease subunit